MGRSPPPLSHSAAAPARRAPETERGATMADAEAAQPAVQPEVPSTGVEAPPARLSEVENALSVLQREAGLTEDTLKVLRKAVNDNLSVPRAGEAPEEAAGGARKRPFKPSSSKRQQLTAEEAAEVGSARDAAATAAAAAGCARAAPRADRPPRTARPARVCLYGPQS